MIDGANCLHVKVKATPIELLSFGLTPAQAQLLLSGRAFAVGKKVKSDHGRNRLLLLHPENDSHLIWIYEDLTEPVL
jgi:hypothetical protein